MLWNILSQINQDDLEKRYQEIFKQLLNHRGLDNDTEIENFLHPPSPFAITPSVVGLSKKCLINAIKLIKFHIQNSPLPILIYGDYDADGITATAIMWEIIRALGGEAIPFIPNRERHGYGLSLSGLQEAIKSPCLVITVDNGIVAHEPIAWLKQQGYQVLLTDHHTPASSLPDADCIVHTTSLCGAGVAWMLAKEINFDLAKQTLDLACIGTIADMMPVLDSNRSFVTHGLPLLSTSSRPGIKALLTEANVDCSKPITPYQVGFTIAPRLNAMGRLDDALDSLRLLCTNNVARAQELAHRLSHTNRTRQDLTLDLLNHAKAKIGSTCQERIIVINDDSYHEGVIGLIAGKLVETYYRPAIVISKKEGISKASARSIPGVNITELIRSQQHLLVGVGGHPMAAGFSIETHRLGEFFEAITKYSDSFIDESMLTPSLSIECELNLSDITPALYDLIQTLQPFGIGNREPIFSLKNIDIFSHQIMGNSGQHLKLLLKRPHDLPLEAIWFGHGKETDQFAISKPINLAFTVNQNTWRGKSTLQLIIKDITY